MKERYVNNLTRDEAVHRFSLKDITGILVSDGVNNHSPKPESESPYTMSPKGLPQKTARETVVHSPIMDTGESPLQMKGIEQEDEVENKETAEGDRKKRGLGRRKWRGTLRGKRVQRGTRSWAWTRICAQMWV